MAQPWTVINAHQLSAYGFHTIGVHAPHTTSGEGVHLTGFSDTMLSLGNAKQAALSKMADKHYLTWGGDHYNSQSFTALIPDFLRGVPRGRVAAFRNRGDHEQFKQTWNTFAQQYPGRFYIVEIDAQNEAATHGVLQEATALDGAAKFFLLGRLAVKLCGTKRVVALGGGRVVAHEMRCGAASRDQWTVFALSRSRQEQGNTLMDEAARNPDVELVRGMDPCEAQAFAQGLPAVSHPPPRWSHHAASPQGIISAHGQGTFAAHGPVAAVKSPLKDRQPTAHTIPPQDKSFQPEVGDKCRGKDANGKEWDVTILRVIDADNFECRVHDKVGTTWPAIHRANLSPSKVSCQQCCVIS